MSINCKNCNCNFDGNFCNNCGQSAKTHKINFHFLIHDLQHAFMHVDKGIVYSAKELFTRPGHSIREYIDGKRVKHFKPLSLIIILAGIYGFLFHFYDINILSNNIVVNGTDKQAYEFRNLVEKITNWISQHYAILAMAQLPIFALGTFIAFKKEGYNYIEHFILNTFLTGQRLLLHIVLFPFYYLANGTEYLRQLSRCIDILGWLMMLWTMSQFFDTQKKWKIILRLMFSYLIIGSILFVLMTVFFKYIVTMYV